MHKNSSESGSSQELTAPAQTAVFPTPTLSFAEVGETEMTVSPGYASTAKGVGQFNETKILERMVKVTELQWAVSDNPSTGNSTPFYSIDLFNYLYNYSRNLDILKQFHYFRGGIELTVRLNTNQFYYGAIVVTLYPTDKIGQRYDERLVLNPTVLSACCEESVVKSWDYSFPEAWIRGSALSSFKVMLSVDILAPLTAGQQIPDSISMTVWARWKDVDLAYPTGPSSSLRPENQMNVPSVRRQKKKKVRSPLDDKEASSATGTGNTMDSIVKAIEDCSISDVASGIGTVGGFLADNWSTIATAAAFLFDKPDRDVVQTPVIIDDCIDMFAADMPDTNPVISLYKQRYLDPAPGRMPMTKNWTVSEYARIPSLKTVVTLTQDSQFVLVRPLLLSTDPDVNKIPLDYAYINSYLWRGSIKYCLQFFTSSFISARIVVQAFNPLEFPLDPPADYTNGISRVINVKGDTTDTFTVPWLSHSWWTEAYETQNLMVSVISTIVSSDTITDPKIYMAVWVAGGEDVQFCFPKVPVLADSWTVIENQVSIQTEFQKSFPAIVENCYFEVDNGFCNTENLSSITDICKRYSPLIGPGQLWFRSEALDMTLPSNPTDSQDYVAFRQTMFGSWRAAFLYRSGGYKFRQDQPYAQTWYAYPGSGGGSIQSGTAYVAASNSPARFTVPQVARNPFSILGFSQQFISMIPNNSTSRGDSTVVRPSFVAARDDVQFGYPILPKVIVLQSLSGKKESKTSRLSTFRDNSPAIKGKEKIISF